MITDEIYTHLVIKIKNFFVSLCNFKLSCLIFESVSEFVHLMSHQQLWSYGVGVKA